MGTDEDLSNDTLIQVVSNLLPITGTDGYYIYSNVYGGPEPWFTTSGQETMDAVYGPGEWTLGFYETLDPEAVFSTSTCFVWMEGGDAMASELETFFDNNTVLIENWVASGGHLFVNSAPNEGDGMSFHFGGVNLFYAYYTNTAEAFDASHPIFDGPFTPVGTSWSGGSFGHAVIQDGGFDTVIVDQFSPSQVVLAEKGWGAGRVMFGGMTPFAFHSPLAEATNLRYNIVSYLASCVLSDIDLGIASIIDPANGCGLGDEAVTVKIRNYGGVPQSDIPVNYQLDGGAVVSETWIGTLDPGETVEYTFLQLWATSLPLETMTSLHGLLSREIPSPEMILLMRSLPIFRSLMCILTSKHLKQVQADGPQVEPTLPGLREPRQVWPLPVPAMVLTMPG